MEKFVWKENSQRLMLHTKNTRKYIKYHLQKKMENGTRVKLYFYQTHFLLLTPRLRFFSFLYHSMTHIAVAFTKLVTYDLFNIFIVKRCSCEATQAFVTTFTFSRFAAIPFFLFSVYRNEKNSYVIKLKSFLGHTT